MGDGVSMEKIRNLSLKKTMVLYTILSLIVTFFLSVSIIEIAGQIQEEVWWKYVDQDEYGTCDFGKLTEWRWLGGKVLCVVFAGMMLAFVPKILKKRG